MSEMTTDDRDLDICPGRCNNAWEAAERAAHDGTGPQEHGLEPEPGQPIWCRPCQDTIAKKLGEIPDLATQLTPGKLNTYRGGDTDTKTNSNIHASPSPAWNTLDALIRWAYTAEDQTRTITRNPPAAGPRYLARTISFLTGYIPALLSRDPDGIDFGMAVHRWHRTLTLASNQHRLTHRLPVPCPSCDHRGTLRRNDGDEHITCRHCSRTWLYDEWNFLTRVATSA